MTLCISYPTVICVPSTTTSQCEQAFGSIDLLLRFFSTTKMGLMWTQPSASLFQLQTLLLMYTASKLYWILDQCSLLHYALRQNGTQIPDYNLTYKCLFAGAAGPASYLETKVAYIKQDFMYNWVLSSFCSTCMHTHNTHRGEKGQPGVIFLCSLHTHTQKKNFLFLFSWQHRFFFLNKGFFPL